MLLRIVSLIAILLNMGLMATVGANHAKCYWTGPGSGTPEQQKFTAFCSAAPMRLPDNQTHSDHGQVIAYRCGGTDSGPYVADWNNLKEDVLELASPCNGPGGGYSNDCSYGLWAACLKDFTDPTTKKKDPCVFWRKWDDCEWPSTMGSAQLPAAIEIYRR